MPRPSHLSQAPANRGVGAAACIAAALLWPALAGGARAQSVTIAIDGNASAALPAYFSGTNVNSADTPVNFSDPAVVAHVKALTPRMLRWPGGTVDDFFDWRTGLVAPMGSTGIPSMLDIGTAVFKPYPMIGFDKQVTSAAKYDGPFLEAKGGNPLGTRSSGFGGFATSVGAKFVVVVNTITDTVDSARQLAQAVAQARLPVAGFELGNEPFYVEIPTSKGRITLPPGSPAVPGAFRSGVDYLTRMKPYYDAIKEGYSAGGLSPAKAVVSVAGGYAADTSTWNVQWAKDMETYTLSHGTYWDAVDFHFYPSESKTGNFSDSMTYANDALVTGCDGFMAGYRAANWSNGKPLLVSEFGVAFSDKVMNGSVYGGIVAAEYVARMSTYPETTSVLMHELFNDGSGINVPKTIAGTDWKKELTALGQTGGSMDTTPLDSSMYNSAEILGLSMVDAAVNDSTYVYGTKVTGAVDTVPTKAGTMPAVFAQAYQGKDGSIHVLVTNKGPNPKILATVVNGQTFQGSISTETVQPSAGDPSENNTATARPVAVRRGQVTGPVTIQGYSVTHMKFVPS